MSVSLVVTSVSKPNSVMQKLAVGCIENEWDFVVVGDRKSPKHFELEGCSFLSIDQQKNYGFKLAENLPEGSYARKNIGYLWSVKNKTEIIVETDDDNYPYDSFWESRKRTKKSHMIQSADWVNVYTFFSKEVIWPRGLPLNKIHSRIEAGDEIQECECPIQQGLADVDPDVDAVYRMVWGRGCSFDKNVLPVVLKNTWSPFNSQNTTWWKEAFSLMYLPSYCSFRMTDIWRSLVAQRIAWENDWGILFHVPTVYQERNAHDFMKDFADEVPGYLHNATLATALGRLQLLSGVDNIPDNMHKCYRTLIDLNLVDAQEALLLSSWFDDLGTLGLM